VSSEGLIDFLALLVQDKITEYQLGKSLRITHQIPQIFGIF